MSYESSVISSIYPQFLEKSVHYKNFIKDLCKELYNFLSIY